MNRPDNGADEEQLVTLLAACDDALAAGETPQALDELATSRELGPRLERNLAWLPVLRRALRPLAQDTHDGLERAPTAAGRFGRDAARKTLGRFVLRRELGRGGFGVVFLAYDPQLRREIALKVPRAEFLVTPELRERFQREARAAAGLDHPNLVPVYEAGDVGPVCYIASAFCPGLNLAAWLKQRSEPIPFRLAATLVMHLAAAVEHAHRRGVVHRDLKPGNVILSAVNPANIDDVPNDLLPKITDFGLAKLIGHEPELSTTCLTRSGTILGTLNYMAPEQAGSRSETVGPAADIYGLGAILYELLTGRPPFKGETELETLQQVKTMEPIAPAKLRPQVPADLQTICRKCLHKESLRRYPSSAALAEDLRRFLDGKPIQARPVSSAERFWRWCCHHPANVTAASLAVVTAAALTGWGVLYTFAQERQRATERLRQQQAQTEVAFEEAQKHRTLLALERGTTLCEQGDVGRGLIWLAHGLQIAPGRAIDLQRSLRAGLGRWQQRVHALRAVLPHDDEVLPIAFSPDGLMIATGGGDHAARLWDSRTGAAVCPPLWHNDYLYAIAFSPDGGALLTGSWDETARVWDTRTGRALTPPLSHQYDVFTVAFSPHGEIAASGGHDQKVRLWKPRSGELIRTLDLQREPQVVAFSPDGGTLLAAGGNGMVQLWDVAAGALRRDCHGHTASVWSASFSPDGQILVTGGWDSTARLWNVETGEPLPNSPLKHAAAVQGVGFSPDGKTLVTSCEDGTAQLWTVATGEPHGQPLVHQAAVRGVAYSPDGAYVATASLDGTARIWSTDTCQPHGAALPHRDGVHRVVFSPDGRLLLTASADSTARLWELARIQSQHRSLPHGGPVSAVTFSPDGSKILTASHDRKARLWDRATLKELGTQEHSDAVNVVLFRPDGQVALTGSHDWTVRLWPLTGGEPMILRHKTPILAAAFSPDGGTVLTGTSRFGDLNDVGRLWNSRTGQSLGAALEHRERVVAVAFSPDGKIAATASGDSTARLWNARTGDPLPHVLRHHGPVYAVAFSPDSRSVITASWDKTARLWDVTTGQVRGEPMQHEGRVYVAQISPDGQMALTASMDGIARLWDTGTMMPRSAAMVHDGAVVAAAFSPDGQLIVTAGADGAARLWHVPTGQPYGTPLQHDGRVLAVAFAPDGKTVLSGSRDGTARLWEIPEPISGPLGRVVLEMEVLTGMQIDHEGVIRVLDAAEWHAKQNVLSNPSGRSSKPRSRTG